ncbi:MAG TPA: sensor histidine kinase [Casimicrobiaceae bacterium]
MRKPDSFRARLVLWAMLPMVIILFASAIATYLIARSVANRAYDYSLLDTARTIAGRIHPVAGGGAPQIALSPGVREVLEYDPLDKVYYGVDSGRYGLLAGRGDLPAPQSPAGPDGTYYDGVIDGRAVRLIALALDDTLRITVAETLNKRQTLTRQILGALLVSEALLVAVGGGLLWYGIRRGMAPLGRVVDALALRGHHDLRPVDPGPVPAELRYLTQAINELMARLDLSLSAQHRFIADATHQLRTPLAGLLAQIEGALMERDPETLRSTLERLQTTAKRAARLVNQLLALARAEPGQQSAIDFEILNLVDLVRTTCKYWVPAALQRRMDLGYVGVEAQIRIEGNSPLLQEMLGNLIENAIRHGDPSSAIDVSLTLLADGRIALAVRNEGNPIPEAERERVFERFHRVHEVPGDGSGLGLAIVRDVARMHRATVELHTEVHANEFRVLFAADCAPPRGHARAPGVTTAERG